MPAATPTHVILSKKGFDADNGGRPSPILNAGRMVSLPIPEPRRGVCASTYADLRLDGQTYADLLRRLGYPTPGDAAAHLDPDLIAGCRPRPHAWRAAFGQVDAAGSLLDRRGVHPGSLFLFWGWYAHEASNGSLARRKGFSAIYGYLEVDQVVRVPPDPLPPLLADHPHLAPEYSHPSNRIYVARERLSWDPSRPGWGVFCYADCLRLTAPGSRRSRWRLPRIFHPDAGGQPSFIGDVARWTVVGDEAEVDVPGRGQEIVYEATSAIAAWARELIATTPIWTPEPTGERTTTVSYEPAPATTNAAKLELAPLDSPAVVAAPRPLPGERVVSYGDRLLWHQLALQLNGHETLMLTESEYVALVCEHFPLANRANVSKYRSYFNNRHASMGFRNGTPMPTPVTYRARAEFEATAWCANNLEELIDP